jgi:hypothetical protein
MKPNHEENRSYVSRLTPVLRYVNMRSLAVVMFVAEAFLSTTLGNETAKTRLARIEAPAEARSQGSLEVYSATDQFNDGGSLYYAHSSYAIYARDGKLFKDVENHISRSDENPETVSLPAGFYMVVARSEEDGFVRVPVMIKSGRRTVLALDR